MFPDRLFGIIDLYEFFLVAGVIAAMVMLRVLGDKTNLDGKLFNFTLFAAVLAIIGGYGSAVLFQAFYNIADIGEFRIDSGTGATFYGGLIGGAALFLLVYFVGGHFVFRDRLHIKEFFHVSGIAAACITAAHSLGRVGCLMAGCCHGRESEKFGIYMEFAGAKVLPVQLYESLFLAGLCVWFTYRALKRKPYNLPLYMICYGVWRFLIEYLRGDARGGTFISFLSPSQLTAIFMVAGGLILWLIERRVSVKTAREMVEKAITDVPETSDGAVSGETTGDTVKKDEE